MIITFQLTGCGQSPILYYSAPTAIPNTTPEMRRPGFWISRHPHPDKIVLAPDEITKLNTRTEKNFGLIKDIASFRSKIEGSELKAKIEETFLKLRTDALYTKSGQKATGKFYKTIEKNIGKGVIPINIAPRFAVVSSRADQRILPTNDPLYAEPGDIDFDELQNSALDIGTPLAVLHRTADKRWYYAEGPLSSGWVEAKNIALCPEKSIKEYLGKRELAVVTAAKADIFLDREMTRYYGYMRMGSTLPFAADEGEADPVTILLPRREKNGTLKLEMAYISKDDVNRGYLPYTARTTIEQAFKLLNTPYGWGGMNGEQDCSRFIQEVFATVGIKMPRNSSAQAKVGRFIAGFGEDTTPRERKKAIAKDAIGGVTLFSLDGHIMLFLGIKDRKPYAVHSLWAYRERKLWRDITFLVNRVAVTGLDLGRGTKKGSYLKRIQTIRIVE